MKVKLITGCFAAFLMISIAGTSQDKAGATLVDVDSGWANNSVNTAIFRKNSLVTFKDTQYIAFYNKDQRVVVGKRSLNSSQWKLQTTPYSGHATDAHNVICIMTDGDGYLHLAWDHHNNKLHYCKSVQPGSLVFSQPMQMTSKEEDFVSYPEFYYLRNGGLLFFYRDGGSGHGNLVINKYNVASRQWIQLQSNLIDGEGQRNAYWQSCTDSKGTIHISWVWRESADVASNHDMCYARSKDGGITWETSTGKKYTLPITAATAEYICHIPQQSELINQTSMFADDNGNPFIASYWRDSGTTVPQYHLLYKVNKDWQAQALDFRKTPFSLSGQGTKRIPVSRPQIVAWQRKKQLSVALIFRDEERNSRISIAINQNIRENNWQVDDLTKFSVESWEPTYDTELWKQKKLLNLFVEKTQQIDGEGNAHIAPQMVQVLQWQP